MNHYIYKITNKINNMKYIGKRSCKCPIEEDKYMGSGVLIKRAIKKYGIENFEKEIIEVCDSETIAYEREKQWIKHLNAVKSRDYYNIKDGGYGNTKEDVLRYFNNMSEEKRKIRSYKLSLANKGENNCMYGKTGKDNPASKPVFMFNLNGEIVKEFECLREVNGHLNKSRADSNISHICIKGGGFFGGYLFLFKSDYEKMLGKQELKKWLDIQIKNANKLIKTKQNYYEKSVYQLDPKTLNIVNSFENIRIAGKETNTNGSNINRVCNCSRNTANGYSWIFKEDFDKLKKEELIERFKRKVSESAHTPRPNQKKKVICTTTNQVFDGLTDAIKYFNMCKGARIDAVCRGTRKSAGKHPETNEPLKWMYYDDYLKLEVS